MLIVHHLLLAQAEGTPPEWVRLVPAGEFRAVDGRGPFRVVDPQAVIAASSDAMPDNLLIDENHATDKAALTGVAAPARARVIELQARADGIWGRPKWTATGAQLMAERAYSGLSPVLAVDESGAVLSIARAALTNTPAVEQLHQFTQQETGRMDLAQFRKALGLADTADEAAILTAVQTAVQQAATSKQQFTVITSAIGLDPTVSVETLVTALQAQKTGTTEIVRLTGMVTTMETELATLKASGAREKAVAFIDAQITGGKPIAARRDWWVAQFLANPIETEALVKGLPSINDGGVQLVDAGGAPVDELTAIEKQVAKNMGVSEADFLKQKKGGGR